MQLKILKNKLSRLGITICFPLLVSGQSIKLTGTFTYYRGPNLEDPSAVFDLRTSGSLDDGQISSECNPCMFGENQWGVELAYWNGSSFVSAFATVDSYTGGRIEKSSMRNWIGKRSTLSTNILGTTGDFLHSGMSVFPRFLRVNDALPNLVELVSGVRPADSNGVEIIVEEGVLKILAPQESHYFEFEEFSGLPIYPVVLRSEFWNADGSSRRIEETRWSGRLSLDWMGVGHEIPVEVPDRYERTIHLKDSDGNSRIFSRSVFNLYSARIQEDSFSPPDWVENIGPAPELNVPFLIE